MTATDAERWQAFLRRFDLEHTFRMIKTTLGRTPNDLTGGVHLTVVSFPHKCSAHALFGQVPVLHTRGDVPDGRVDQLDHLDHRRHPYV
jgi:hypothetical protein